MIPTLVNLEGVVTAGVRTNIVFFNHCFSFVSAISVKHGLVRCTLAT